MVLTDRYHNAGLNSSEAAQAGTGENSISNASDAHRHHNVFEIGIIGNGEQG